MLSFVMWPQFGGFPFLFPEFWNFMIMSFDITLFFTYYARYLKSPHIWNPMSFSTVFFSSFNVSDFLPTSFFILSLLSSCDQKINFPNRLSEFFILLFPQSYVYFKNLIAGNFSQLYLPTILLLKKNFSDHNFQKLFTVHWIHLLISILLRIFLIF